MAELGHLHQIKLSGFRSIKELTLDLAPLNILIGANGAGKSNFISFFKLMNKLQEKELQLHVRTKLNGANRTLYFGRKTTSQLKIELLYAPIRYGATLVPTNDDSLVFASEHVQLQVPNAHFLGKPPTLAAAGAPESGLPNPGTSSLQQVAAKYLSDWKVYHFHDTSDSAMLKSAYSIHAADRLLPQGENLAAFLYGMRETENYRRIIHTIQRVAPFFHDFIFQPEANDLIRLRWKHKGSEDYFDANMLSDGTLRFICMTTLLLQPNLPTMVLLDEPELGLHPFAMQLLAAMMRSVSKHTQIIASTQSVTLANQFSWQDMVVVDQINNASHFRRLQEAEVVDWLDQYKLGEVWEMNALGGTPE